MRQIGRIAAGVLALGWAVGAGVGSLAADYPGERTEAEIAAMGADQIVENVQTNVKVIALYVAELHRRHPEIALAEGVEIPKIDAAAEADLRKSSDDAIVAVMESVDAENDKMIARYKVLRPDDVPAEQKAAAAPPKPKPATVAASQPKDYCKAMYGKAYMLCGSDDRSCKMIAASDWGICKKTGRWP